LNSWKNGLLILNPFILNIQKMAKKEMTIVERLTAPTSSFFRILRNVGLCLAAVGGALIAAPVALPAAIVTVAG
jgi:hypothetical protein